MKLLILCEIIVYICRVDSIFYRSENTNMYTTPWIINKEQYEVSEPRLLFYIQREIMREENFSK